MIVTRVAKSEDLPAIASMVDDFVRDHPARHHPRSIDGLRAAYFGDQPVGEIIVAVRGAEVVGMAEWSRVYDLFWGMRGGRADWLYVRPSERGLGTWAAIAARMAERVEAWGGEFLTGAANDRTRRLYARAALPSGDTTDFHLSGEAFAQVACLAHRSPRDIIRHLPDPELNKVAPRNRD